MATTRPNRNIADFKGKLVGGGARPNLFEVQMARLPDGISWDADVFQFMCKAATLPASTIANIDVPFRGRIFKVAGDRTVDVWSITVINDEDFRLRNAFEEWMDRIAKLDNNLGATSPEAYMVDAEVFQLGRGSTAASTDSTGTDNTVLKQYKFQSLFTTSL